ncbi:MAG: CBS domain-containing protein [Caldisericia bacterium]|nr:CBS domain-containing protein [Caldisericia bacterium]MDD4614634.1 CBS domain-containing protein [Caldisericia bacterium]
MSAMNIIKDEIVSDIMTKNLEKVYDDQCIDAVADILTKKGLNALPVVSHTEKLVGIITLGDLLLKATRTPLFDMWTTGIYDNTEDLLKEYKKIVGTDVKDVMSTHPFTIKSTELVSRAATIMYRRKVKQLPVLDDEGKLVGIITATDVVKLLYGNA